MAELGIERIAKLEAQIVDVKDDVAAVKQDIKELNYRITTGNREIMDKFEEKIDELVASEREQSTKLQSSMEQVKARVDTLEKWRWMIVGGATVIGFLLGHLDFFAKLIK